MHFGGDAGSDRFGAKAALDKARKALVASGDMDVAQVLEATKRAEARVKAAEKVAGRR